MASRVISISRSLGAGGEEIGRTVAKKLGFRYADQEIVIRAAEKAGVSPESAAQAEHTPGLIARILESIGSTPDPVGWSSHAALPSHALPAYEGLFERVIRETANRGNVVIVAHGASFPLAGTSGLLRVLVTASPRVRVQRLAGETNLEAAEARKAIADSDRQRREYLRRFYDIRQELPTHYDLVVNTDVLTLPLAAKLVVSAAKGQQVIKRV
ncbi:MAG: cytidylate kinase-like family protein [Dehalococcoidia bacterium]|nr:MAG: cytidylate kinase-like family protein [Dehalococcoidia bacterium]